MTREEKQIWLWRYQRARPKLVRLDGELSELTRQNTVLQRLLSGLRKDKAERFEGKRKRLEGEIRRVVKELAEIDRVRLEIAEAINRVEEPRLRQVLEYHYLQGEPWDYVACRMQYSQRYIYDLHRRALEEVQLLPGTRKPHPAAGPCRMYCMNRREACA